jgi:hypothetical protein
MFSTCDTLILLDIITNKDWSGLLSSHQANNETIQCKEFLPRPHKSRYASQQKYKPLTIKN